MDVKKFAGLTTPPLSATSFDGRRPARDALRSRDVSFWNAGARADADESLPPDPGSNRVISTTEVMEMKTLRTFAALLLALGVLTTASAAFADRGDDPQSLRGEQPEDIQAS
jgi:hypothetical protein